MRIGVMAGATPGPDGTLDGLVERAKALEAQGFASMWLANIFGLDAINALGIVGRETERIELGTAVVPSPPRHPVAKTASLYRHGSRRERPVFARSGPLSPVPLRKTLLGRKAIE